MLRSHHHNEYESSKGNVSRNHFCRACVDNCSYGFVYKYSECSVILEVKCALLTQVQKLNKIHPNHPHPLILCAKDKNFEYSCTRCDLPFVDGSSRSGSDSGMVYACLECKGLLHEACDELPWTIENPFHPLQILSCLSVGHLIAK